MKLKSSYENRNEENLIPLINVVFLMLIFFLIAGAIKTFSTKEIEMTSSATTEKLGSQTIKLHISKDGLTYLNDVKLDKDSIVEELKVLENTMTNIDVSIIPDKELKASILIETIELIKQAPVRSINLIAIRKQK